MAPIKSLLIALLATSAIAAPLSRRQLAGEGQAADSLLTDTDSTTGYSIENIEDNTANAISGVTGDPSGAPADGTNTGAGQNGASGSPSGGSGSGGPPPPPPPPPPNHKRQLDKISKGAQAIGNSLGIGAVTAPATSAGETADGDLTGGAANLGAEVGTTEENTIEGASTAVP